MGHTRLHMAFLPQPRWLDCLQKVLVPYTSPRPHLKITARAKVDLSLMYPSTLMLVSHLGGSKTSRAMANPKSGLKNYAKKYSFLCLGFPALFWGWRHTKYINFALEKKMRHIYKIKNLIARKALYISIYLLGFQPSWLHSLTHPGLFCL